MRRSFMPVLVLALLAVVLSADVAYGDTAADNAQCLSCHGESGAGSSLMADFSVGGVDYSACNTCHSKYKHFEHPGVPTPCTNCHLGARAGAPYYYSDTVTEHGYFSDISYASKTPEQLHAIHANGSWVATYFRAAIGCRNCHASASCSACHTSVAPHADHALPDYPPMPYTTATGSSTTSVSSTCINDACHDLQKSATADFIPACSSCHFTFEDHYGAERHTSSWAPLVACSGAECHSASGDLMAIHVEKDASFTCAGCHSSFRVAGQIRDGLTGCGDCHDGVTQSSGHRDIHGANPSLETTAHVPNYAYNTGSAGTPKTSDCVGCHTSNLVDEHLGLFYGGNWIISPRFSSAGSALTCATCHSSADSTVRGAIDSGLSSCESCHPVHGPIAAVHATTFDSSTGIDCAQCHSAQLETEHNGTYTTTTPSGRTLAGCAVCHSYWEGERGAEVEAVISASGQTQCSACHGAQHPDLGSHTVSSAASQECAGCHDKGGTTSIDVKAIHAGAALGACAVCHNNSPRVGDLSAMTAECASCHEGHGDLAAAHTTTGSQGCVECHGSADIRTVHATSAYGECDVCHKANVREAGRIDWALANQECDSCHSYEPVETQHYPAASHTAVHTDVCVSCHLMDLKAEHAKASVTCAQCHTDPQDKTIIAAGWNGNCDQCHLDSHADKPARHTSIRTDCSTSGCHESDVAVIHGGLSQLGCSTCHTGPTQLSSDLTKDCTSSGCHSAYHDGVATAHTASSSSACTRCHDAALPDGSQLEPIHKAGCATCHNTTINTATKTAECTTCHNGTVSPFHLELTGAHTYGGMDAGCQQSGCHLKTLPEEHAKYLGRYSDYADTCALCHENTDANRIDWDTATAACDTCHTIHGDIATVHTATDSGTCVACHETGDAMVLHQTDAGEPDCALCHAAPADRIDWGTATIECASCHGGLTPEDLNHYPAESHDASAETGCNQCHYKDMKAEHLKPTVAVSCVACHEQKVDAFTAPWDKTCTVCHPTKHGNQASAHKSTNTACTGTGCHVVTDVSVLHGTNCAACHAAGVTASTNCTLCHTGSNPHHVTIPLKATTDSGWRTMCGSCHRRTHSMSGCSRCHSASKLHSESRHTDTNARCAGCHKVATADVSKNCLACHASVQGGSSGGSWGGGSWGWR